MHTFQDGTSDSFPITGENTSVSTPSELQAPVLEPNVGIAVGAVPVETPAQRRRRERIALVEELGGHEADIKQAALEAIKRGMYSPRTSRGDVELCLMRTWMLRKRSYGR